MDLWGARNGRRAPYSPKKPPTWPVKISRQPRYFGWLQQGTRETPREAQTRSIHLGLHQHARPRMADPGLNWAPPRRILPAMADHPPNSARGPEPLPLTEADLAAVQVGMALTQSGWQCRIRPNGTIAVADQEGELVFAVGRRSDGRLGVAHWHDDPEAPEAGFRELVAESLSEALEMMRELVAKGF
jgi:hypothetical protein